MRWLQGTNTSRFNARHRLRGAVFGVRYKTIAVQQKERDELWMRLAYVHLNCLGTETCSMAVAA